MHFVNDDRLRGLSWVVLTRDETSEEWLILQVLVVGLKVLLVGADQLCCNQLVASLLESRHDVSDESSLDTIWLDCDETRHNREQGFSRTPGLWAAHVCSPDILIVYME